MTRVGRKRRASNVPKTVVCAACLADEYLARVIGAGDPHAPCSFCGKLKEVASVHDVAAAVDKRLTEVARRVTSVADPRDQGADGRSSSDGRPLRELLAVNLRAAKDGVSDALCRALLAIGKARRDSNAEPAWSGRYRYSALAHPTSSAELEGRWEQYRGFVHGGSRFFNADARKFLDALLDAMERLKVKGLFQDEEAIRLLKVLTVHRARLANTQQGIDRILQSASRELDAPPPTLARAGRMNAERVPVFYGAYQQNTAVAELRPAIGGHAVVGQFLLVRPIRVLDMTMLERTSGATISIWDPKYKERSAMRALLQRLHERIKRPVLAGAEHDYLATQVLADYLSVFKEVDGIVFASAQHEGGKNIVIFARALGSFEDSGQSYPSSPLKFVENSAQVIAVNGVEYDLKPVSVKRLAQGKLPT